MAVEQMITRMRLYIPIDVDTATGYGGLGSDSVLTGQTMTEFDVIASADPQTLVRAGLVDLSHPVSLSKKVLEDIRKNHGWVHADTVEGVEAKKTLKNEYWLFAPKSYRRVNIRVEDLGKLDKKLNGDYLQMLLDGTVVVVQTVSLKSIAPSVFKKLQDKKKKADQRKLDLKKKREEKQVEQSKKILAKLGQL